VNDIFAEGTKLRNFYTGEEATVKDQSVTFKESSRLLLIEKI